MSTKMQLIPAKKTFNSNLIERSSIKFKPAWKIIKNCTNSAKDSKTEMLVSDEFNDFFVSSANQWTSTIARPNVSSTELLYQKMLPIAPKTFSFTEVTPKIVLSRPYS